MRDVRAEKDCNKRSDPRRPVTSRLLVTKICCVLQRLEVNDACMGPHGEDGLRLILNEKNKDTQIYTKKLSNIWDFLTLDNGN